MFRLLNPVVKVNNSVPDLVTKSDAEKLARGRTVRPGKVTWQVPMSKILFVAVERTVSLN